MGPRLWDSPKLCSCSFPFPWPGLSLRTPRDWSASRCWRWSGDAAARRPVSPAQQPPSPHGGLAPDPSQLDPRGPCNPGPYGPRTASFAQKPRSPPVQVDLGQSQIQPPTDQSPGCLFSPAAACPHLSSLHSAPFNFIPTPSTQALLFPFVFASTSGMLPEPHDVGTTPLSTVSLLNSPTATLILLETLHSLLTPNFLPIRWTWEGDPLPLPPLCRALWRHCGSSCCPQNQMMPSGVHPANSPWSAGTKHCRPSSASCAVCLESSTASLVSSPSFLPWAPYCFPEFFFLRSPNLLQKPSIKYLLSLPSLPSSHISHVFIDHLDSRFREHRLLN